MYLFDTDTFSNFLREETFGNVDAVISRRMAHAAPGVIAISAVTVGEMMRGALNLLSTMAKAGRDDAGYGELLRIYSAWQRFPILPYDAGAHARFATFPADARRAGRADCQIAAIAIERGLTVVTTNIKHFAQIPGVSFEDWTRPGNNDPSPRPRGA